MGNIFMSSKKSTDKVVKDKVTEKVKEKSSDKSKTKDKSEKGSKDKVASEKGSKEKVASEKGSKKVDKSMDKSAVEDDAIPAVDTAENKPKVDIPLQEFYNDTLETLVYDKNSANYNKLVTVEEAYRIRSQWTSQVIQNVLFSKRESLVSQIKSLEERIEECKNNRI